MCEANSLTGPPKRKPRRTDWAGIVLGAFVAPFVADLIVVSAFPNSAVAHWRNRHWWGIPIAVIESDIRELDEAIVATAGQLDRTKAERQSLQGELDRGSLPPGLSDSKFARIVIRRDALDEEIVVLEARLSNLGQALDRNREALARCRAERARHVEALHTQN